MPSICDTNITGYPETEEMVEGLKTARQLRTAAAAEIPTQTGPPELENE